MSLDTVFPQQPGTGGSIPLTRRELRERERAAMHEGTKSSTQPSSEQPVEAPTVPVLAEPVALHTAESTPIDSPASVNIEAALPTRRSLREHVATPVKAAKPTKAAARVRAQKARPANVKSKRVRVSPATFSTSGPPRRRAKAFASKVLSCVAMLFAGALLVGVSVPSNAFIGSSDIAIAADSLSDAANLAADSRPTQSLAVSDDVINDLVHHDNLKVISYAEVLAIQYAGVSYEYRATAGAIRWPFPYEIPITDGFGDRIGGFHKGTDFATASGTPIYAIADGVVSYVQADYSGYGYHAIISHVVNGQRIETLYAHMSTDSSPLVVGDSVRVGDFVGLVGATGISYGAHLHLEIHLDEVPVDPFAWLTANAVN